MEIKYVGHSSFLIKTKNARVLTDPFDPKAVGLKFPKTETDIVTISHNHDDHSHMGQVVGAEGAMPLVIDMPGEFESRGVRIFGFSSFHDDKKGEERGENNLYKIEAEGISILHCGDLGVVLDDSVVDAIGDVDILMVPTGGLYTINSAQAVELVKKVEPSIVIPMHFKRDGINEKVFGSLEPIEEFLKKLGAENVAPVPKLVIKNEEMADEMKVIVLSI